MNETLNEIKKILNDANVDEANVKARIILREVGNLSVEDMLLQKEVQNKDEVLNFARKLAETKAPIQYLLGYANFMGEKFIVNSSTLIPRDETEILVNCALDKINKLREKKQDTINVLDIGTGSGCIACMIAKNAPEAEVLGVDVSSDALQVALENAQKLDLIKRVVYRKSDIFSAIRGSEKFDVVVSNPPYIKEEDYKNLDIEVREFEPKSALFAKDDGLEFYKKIIKNAAKYVNYDGYIAFECAKGQAGSICILLERNGFLVTDVIKDLAGIDRVVAARMILVSDEVDYTFV